VLKHVYILLVLNFPLNMQAASFSLISDITPSIPIYLFNLTASKQ
jgi:hypothetical protein